MSRVATENGFNHSLETFLSYDNSLVVESFSHAYKIPYEESEEIFKDLLKYLWITTQAGNPDLPDSIGAIDPALLIIDEMWHTFVLHTVEYMKFCHDHVGHFIHHVPTPTREKVSQKRIKDLSKKELNDLIESRREKYSAVYDLLGHETFVRWYHHLPVTYSRDIIRDMRSKSI